MGWIFLDPELSVCSEGIVWRSAVRLNPWGAKSRACEIYRPALYYEL